MSLEKSIKSGKEKRKPYHGSKAIDRSCRNHGSCRCWKNRIFSFKRELERVMSQEKDIYTRCYLDNLVSGNLTNGEFVTIEEWNAEVDRKDEERNLLTCSRESDIVKNDPIENYYPKQIIE